jgi:hypothetical protein
VNDRYRLLDAHQAARQRGVDIANHNNATRLCIVDDRFEPAHDFRPLLRMGPRSDLKVDIRRTQVQIGEQSIVHGHIVVLTRVHQQRRRSPGLVSERSNQWRHLHVIRPRADHAHDCGERLRGFAHQ